jgi:hypothetical protein
VSGRRVASRFDDWQAVAHDAVRVLGLYGDELGEPFQPVSLRDIAAREGCGAGVTQKIGSLPEPTHSSSFARNSFAS